MATNGKTKKESTAVATTTKKAPSTKAGTQDVAAVAQHGATLLQNVYKDIAIGEAQRDAEIDAMEARIIEAHMKMLEDNSISIEKRQEILDTYYSRVDKKRQYAAKTKQENTKRWKAALWWATFCVLGAAAFRCLPDIIDAFNKSKRI